MWRASARACEGGRVRGLPGMGQKTEANLLRAIASYQARSDRSLLGVVEPQASELVTALRQLPGGGRRRLRR